MKVKYCFGTRKPKGLNRTAKVGQGHICLNRTAKVGQGHICLEEEYLTFNNNYMI